MTTARTWGGRSAEQRRTERRDRLIETALDIWREGGWTAVTIRAVCARAGLNDRYFYETFTDREDLLVAAWEHVRDEMLAALMRVFDEHGGRPLPELIENACATVLQRISDDPSFGTILLRHHAGSPTLEACRDRALQLTADLVVSAAQGYLEPGTDPLGLRMDAIAAVGGFVELISAWQSGVLDCDADRITQHLVHLAERLEQPYLDSL